MQIEGDIIIMGESKTHWRNLYLLNGHSGKEGRTKKNILMDISQKQGSLVLTYTPFCFIT